MAEKDRRFDPDFLVERDPQELNSHVRVEFSDVIGEPDGAHSHPCLFKCSYGCFNCGKKCCYYLLTFLCGWWLSLCWGCQFGIMTCLHIWQFTPALRVMQINCGFCQKIWGTCLSCFLAPLCETCGLVFSRITVTSRPPRDS